MRAMAAPFSGKVDVNSPEFRAALYKAGAILAGTALGVGLHHRQFALRTDEVMFADLAEASGWVLYPWGLQSAQKYGLPSHWRVEPDGSLTVLQYVDTGLHKNCGIDVTSQSFQARLAVHGEVFASMGLGQTLEITIAPHLFPRRDDQVALEVTKPGRLRHLGLVPRPSDPDWSAATGWRFDGVGRPVVVSGDESDTLDCGKR